VRLQCGDAAMLRVERDLLPADDHALALQIGPEHTKGRE